MSNRISYDNSMDHILPTEIHNHSKRKLYGTFIPHAEINCGNANGRLNSDVRCVQCQNLDKCKALNGYHLQEVYYPGNPELSGTCTVIENLASELYQEIFGPSKTFRDIPVCRGTIQISK